MVGWHLRGALYRVVARWRNTTVACLRHGHFVERIVSSNLYTQKAGQPLRDWFDGMLVRCRRSGCTYEKYIGSLKPWKKDLGPTSKGDLHEQS